MAKYSKKGREQRLKSREGYAEFYKKHIALSKGKRCANCGTRLKGHVSEIAHVFEKSSYPEVATNDDNVLYMCGMSSPNQCHTYFDSTLTKASSMKVWPKALEKFEIIKDLLVRKTSKKYRFFRDAIDDIKKT